MFTTTDHRKKWLWSVFSDYVKYKKSLMIFNIHMFLRFWVTGLWGSWDLYIKMPYFIPVQVSQALHYRCIGLGYKHIRKRTRCFVVAVYLFSLSHLMWIAYRRVIEERNEENKSKRKLFVEEEGLHALPVRTVSKSCAHSRVDSTWYGKVGQYFHKHTLFLPGPLCPTELCT